MTLILFFYYTKKTHTHTLVKHQRSYMVKSFHLNLLRQHYHSNKDVFLDNLINIEVHEDNILKYDYSIHPNIQKGTLSINYMDDNTVQMKCTHLNQGKPETLFFKYDPYELSAERFSLRDVVVSISNLCQKSNKRHRYDKESPESKNDCEIYYNQLAKRRKVYKEL